MAETYFDTNLGELFIGGEAMDSLDIAATSIESLQRILQEKDFPYKRGTFDVVNTTDWERTDYITYGKWLLNVVKGDQPEYVSLTQKHIRRMQRLGLGPGETEIYDKGGFNNYTDFKRAVGSPFNRVISNAFDGWYLFDFVEYAKKISRRVGGRPRPRDYDTAAKDYSGPTYKIIEQRFGGAQLIHDKLGFPLVKTWCRDDYIDWGVRVIDANNGILHWLHPEILSKADRGPSIWSIRTVFGSFQDFEQTVNAEHALITEQREIARARKHIAYVELLTQGQLPESYTDLPRQELFIKAGKYLLATSICKDIPSKADLIAAVDNSSAKFKAALFRWNPNLSVDIIEREALLLDVYDDIWPYNDHLVYLNVSQSQIEEALERHRQRHNRNKQKRKERLSSAA